MNRHSTPVSFIGRSSASFDIFERLGQGGMGVVYRAVDRKLGRQVALKFLSAGQPVDADARERFLREARAASMLDHPNIGTIYAIEEGDSGELCIVMAYYDGQSVAERLTDGPIPSTEALSIAVQAADGLAEAHAQGIIHRDIKPSNLMLTRSGVVKIVDFGLARISEQSEPLTQPYAVLGTTAYMSPEQARGEQADARSEVWSLGAVLAEMIAGKRPFRGNDSLSQIYALLNHEPDLSGIEDAEVVKVLRRALSKDRASRYSSMAEFAAALRDIAGQATTLGLVAPVASEKPAFPGRTWKTGAGVLAVVLLAIPALAPPVRSRIAHLLESGMAPSAPMVIAFLPFSNVEDPAAAALATGLSESLSQRIGKLERFSGALTVISTGEVMTREVRDSADAARVFGATAVLTGSLRRDSTGALVLDMELQDRHHRQPVRLTASGVLPLEERSTVWLCNALDIRANARSAGRLTSSDHAYEAWLRGVGYLQRWDRPENLTAAIAAFTESIQADPEFARGYAGLAEASRTRFRTDLDAANIQHALNYAQQAIRIDQGFPEGHVVLGRVYQETAQRDLAVIEFQKALNLDPRNVPAMAGMARTYEDLGRSEEGEAAYQSIVKLVPYSWNALNSLGSFYIRCARFADAERVFTDALRLTPDNPTLHSNLGVSLLRQNEMSRAAEAFRRSLQLGPSYQAYVNLGNIYYRERDFRRAADTYGKALQLNSKDFRIWGTQAQALRLAGAGRPQTDPAYRNAIRLAEEAWTLNPGKARTSSLLAIYYASVGDRQNAGRALDRALAAASGDRQVLVDAATAYELLGDRRTAVRWANQALAEGVPWKELRDDPDLTTLIASGAISPPAN